MTSLVFTAPTVCSSVELNLNFDVADAPSMRDHSHSPFMPEVATVSFMDGRPSYISAKGRRIVSSRYTTGGFSIEDDGRVLPDFRGDAPPLWMVETVAKAMQHPAVVAIRESDDEHTAVVTPAEDPNGLGLATAMWSCTCGAGSEHPIAPPTAARRRREHLAGIGRS
jgi:hypothetical protein